MTNAVTYLPCADQILVLKDGVISEIGTYKELLEKEGAFADFINTHATKDNACEDDDDEEEEEEIEEGEEDDDNAMVDGEASAERSSSPSHSLGKRRKSSVKSTSLSPRKNSHKPAASPPVAAKPQAGAKLTTEEGVEKGRVKTEVMVTYMRSVGWFFTTLTLLMFLAQNGFMFYSSVWLKEWSDGALPKEAREEVEENNNNNSSLSQNGNETLGSPEPQKSAAFSSEVYLGVYAVLGVAQGITILMCKLRKV